MLNLYNNAHVDFFLMYIIHNYLENYIFKQFHNYKHTHNNETQTKIIFI